MRSTNTQSFFQSNPPGEFNPRLITRAVVLEFLSSPIEFLDEGKLGKLFEEKKGILIGAPEGIENSLKFQIKIGQKWQAVEELHSIPTPKPKVEDLRVIVWEGGMSTSSWGSGASHKSTDWNDYEFSRLIESKKKSKRKFDVHLLIAPTKNHKRIEWMVEKVVEIGINRISFLICKNSIRKTINLDRLNKIALSAMKQTQNTFLPVIDQCIPFSEAFKLINSKEKYIAHLQSKDNVLLNNCLTQEKSKCILIGPEGDFDEDEVEYSLDQGFIGISLGSSRLRTETSGIVSTTILNINNG